MEAKEFAEKYAGQDAVIYFPANYFNSRYNGTVVKIIGYGNPYNGDSIDDDVYDIWVDEGFSREPFCDDPSWAPDTYVVPKETIKGILRRFPSRRLQVEVPDDCLCCGAKGIEPCKNNCPNKE